MATMEVMHAVESSAFERDQQEFALGDTLDIKTGLILAGVTFLAILTGDLMKSTGISHGEVLATIKAGAPVNNAIVQWSAQFVSVLAIVGAGIFSVAVLVPRNYDREPVPTKYLNWIQETEAYRVKYPDAGAESVTAEKLIAKRVENAVANIQTNIAHNRRKSALMFIAFNFMVVSLAANIFTLAMRLF
jgi:hypothetical protein